MQLYKLTENYQNISNYIDDAEEIDENVLIDTLESINEAFDDKAVGIAYLIRNQDADTKTIDEEMRRLRKLKSTKQNAVNRLKQYLLENMIAIDKQRIESDLFKISVRNNPESVHLIDESALTDEYIKNNPKPDLTAIKEALKRGEVVEGAELVRKKSLQIR